MDQELESIASRLTSAGCPEDVFGKIEGLYDEMIFTLQKKYRAIARIVHPDLYQTESEQRLAHAAFHSLTNWLGKAREKIRSGAYGRKVDPSRTVLRTRKNEYALDGSYVQERRFNLYPCSFMEDGRLHRAVLKVAREARDNSFAEREIRALRTLSRSRDAEKFSAYIPNLIDHFVYENAGAERQAAVLEKYDGWYSLENVHHAYPHGIDPKDMAWMWRRLLVALGFAHTNGILHGAVLPRNVWILPEEHGLMLVNWERAVFDPFTMPGGSSTISSEDAGWYSQEFLRGQSPSFGTDILMSAKVMLWLLGGDPQAKVFPDSIPTPLRAFLKGCILPDRRAPQNAWSLKEEVDELLERLWGKRRFHPFTMK
jgi:serine/threonine protein kinase